MRWASVACVLAGCSFDHGFAHSTGDAALADAPPIDAATDAPPDAEAICHVGVANATGVVRGTVGGDGGSENFPPLACVNAGDQLVGIALRMSNQDTIYGARSAHGIRIACAPVTARASGGTTGTVTTYEIQGNGNFDWSPSTWTPLTQCKPGWILAGITAHTTDDDDLFLDVSITCARIDTTGAVAATELLYVDGSLDEPNGLDTEVCNPGEIVVRMPNRSGAGLDALTLFCATPTCT